jgi:DUF971 family protein
MKHDMPEEIRLQQGRAALTLVYGGAAQSLPAELLRVYSPSAEVRGHGVGQEVLQTGKAASAHYRAGARGQLCFKNHL